MSDFLVATQQEVKRLSAAVTKLEHDLAGFSRAYFILAEAMEAAIEMKDVCLIQGSQATVLALIDHLEKALVYAEIEAAEIETATVSQQGAYCTVCCNFFDEASDKAGRCMTCR